MAEITALTTLSDYTARLSTQAYNRLFAKDGGSTPDATYAALIARELDPEDLSARRLASLLGKTTGALYHRWGSVDGALFTVGQRGFADLQARFEAAWSRDRDVAACAVARPAP